MVQLLVVVAVQVAPYHPSAGGSSCWVVFGRNAKCSSGTPFGGVAVMILATRATSILGDTHRVWGGML